MPRRSICWLQSCVVLANRTAAEPTSGLGVQHFVTSMVRGAQRGLSRLGHLGLYAIAGLSYFYWPGIWAPQGYRCKLVANIQTACSRFKHTVGEVVGGYPTYRLAGEGGQETLEKKVGFPAGRWPDPEAWHLRSDGAAARRIPGSAVRAPSVSARRTLRIRASRGAGSMAIPAIRRSGRWRRAA